MTTIDLAYGQTGLTIDIDDHRAAATVISPVDPPAIKDPAAAVLQALRHPLAGPPFASFAGGQRRVRRVAIAISDHTRPVPDRILLPLIVAELGVPDEAVTILIGTGTHRASTSDELLRMLGPDILDRFTIVNHDCQDRKELVHVGESSCGGPCWLNRRYVDADLRLATGFIEPHFFAGFSGGTKAIVPGIAGLETIRHFHRAALIAHPRTTWGALAGNPLQALSREMTSLCPPAAVVNVTLDHAKRITGVYAGAPMPTHDAGSLAVQAQTTVTVPRRFPVVVTTNSGYPLDQNFYQTVKGISAAARIVEPGGTILVASECRNGLPDEGAFRSILAEARPSRDLLQSILASRDTRHDQWQVQTLLQCLEQARIVLHSSLSGPDRALTRTEHGEDVTTSLDHILPRQGRPMPIAILPRGPLTIPTLAPTAAGP